MFDFKAPQDEILFSLVHVADATRIPSWDSGMAGDIIAHFSNLAEGVIAPLNASGDAQGAQLDNGRVRMPNGFRDAYRQLAGDGWQGLTAPEEFGGMGASPLVAAGVSEIFSGANHALQMVCNLVPGAITTLRRFGSPVQQQNWIPRLAAGEALSTMCLSEPGAGSDLSTIRCRATQSGSGWKIDGEKIFISGGDQDMSETILHLVLARTGLEEDGIRGLSLFLCSAQPAISVTRIEDKMGLHASPTCQLRFDQAEAELVGQQGEGLKAMFTLMNHARIDVALQGVAHASRASQIACAYTAERRQGRTTDGRPAMLSDHADVQRMLNEQEILAIGARAMCHIALVELESGDRPALAEFLTPLCKVFGSNAGIKSADLGIQLLGGYGYLREYAVEQHWRDARIAAIYEGANGIHEKTLVTRGLRQGGGADEFVALVTELADEAPAIMPRLQEWKRLRKSLSDSQNPLPVAHEFTALSARLYLQACWYRIGCMAHHHPEPDHISRLAEAAVARG